MNLPALLSSKLESRFTQAELGDVGRRVEKNTLRFMALGGIGENVRPVLNDILMENGFTPTDLTRSWLVTHAAEHSEILNFLNPSRDPHFSLDNHIDEVMQRVSSMPSPGFSSSYHKAVDTLAAVMAEHRAEIIGAPGAETLGRTKPELMKQILAEAAARMQLSSGDEFTEFQRECAFRQAIA